LIRLLSRKTLASRWKLARDMTEEQKEARVVELAEMLEVSDVLDRVPPNSAPERSAPSPSRAHWRRTPKRFYTMNPPQWSTRSWQITRAI